MLDGGNEYKEGHLTTIKDKAYWIELRQEPIRTKIEGRHGFNSDIPLQGYLQRMLPITSLCLRYLSLWMWRTLMINGTIFQRMTRSPMLTLHQLQLILAFSVAIMGSTRRGGASSLQGILPLRLYVCRHYMHIPEYVC